MSKYPSGISYDDFYAALDAYCDAMIRAALEAGAKAAETHFLDAGTTASSERTAGRMIAEAIRALKDDAKVIAAIKARAGGHT
jgi:hypothetical protein